MRTRGRWRIERRRRRRAEQGRGRWSATASRSNGRGWSLVEVLVALAVLSCGFLPLFQLLRGTRGQLGQTREMLVLERRALEALERGAGLAGRGQLRDLAEREERSFDWSTPDAKAELAVSRVPGRRLFRMVARTASRDRAVTLAREVFDPLAAYMMPADPLPEPAGQGGRP